MLALLLALALQAPIAHGECEPPEWYVRVYFRSPFDACGPPLSELHSFCAEADARSFRDQVDQHGMDYGVSYVWNDVPHSGVTGFLVIENVWARRR